MGETERSAAAIGALFEAYAAAFDDADAEAVAALFAFPAVIWQFGEGHVFADADELLENVEALIEVFHEAGVVATTPHLTAVSAEGTAGFAAIDWRQEDEAGQIIHEFACGYLLVAGDDGWRIAAIVNEPPA